MPLKRRRHPQASAKSGTRPRRRWLTIFHRWLGCLLAIYVGMICLTGSVLIYRVELHEFFDRRPTMVSPGMVHLSEEILLTHAGRAVSGGTPISMWRSENPHQAVEVVIERDSKRQVYLFDPYTGALLGLAQPLGHRIVETLVLLHTSLLSRETGRLANGFLAFSFILFAATGLCISTPQKAPRKRTRATPGSRAGTLRRLHIKLGNWTSVFILMWGITGIHLVFPWIAGGIVDYFEPFDEYSLVERTGDRVSYWFTYVHFGRFGGRIPGCEQGLCDQSLKAVWAIAALIPILLGGTGLFLSYRRYRAKLKSRYAERFALGKAKE